VALEQWEGRTEGRRKERRKGKGRCLVMVKRGVIEVEWRNMSHVVSFINLSFQNFVMKNKTGKH